MIKLSQHYSKIIGIIVITISMSNVLLAGSSRQKPWGSIFSQTTTTNLAWERYYIEGFAWPTSVKANDSVRIYVSVRDTLGGHNYQLRIYRVAGPDSLVWGPSTYTGKFFPLHGTGGALDTIMPWDYSRKPIEFKNGCKSYWQSGSIAIQIPSSWQSGVYYAKLTHNSLPDSVAQKNYYAHFVVRASVPGSTSKILFKLEQNTLHAYNYWGGGSLYSYYQDPSSLTSTDTIAEDRPLSFDQSQATTYFMQDLVKILRDSGYTMEYCNSIDLDSIPANSSDFVGSNLLPLYRLLIIWNHDEYWSSTERSNVEDTSFGFKGKLVNGNIGRFAPNTCYWRVNWIGAGHSRLYCRKDFYPPWNPPYDLWRDSIVGPNKPEAKFLGEQYQGGWNTRQADPLTESPPDKVFKPDHWAFKGTVALGKDSSFGIGVPRTDASGSYHLGIVMSELDNTITGRASYPLDTIAQRYVYSRYDSTGYFQYRNVLHQMIYYEDTTTNSRVFAAGAGAWWLGINSEADNQPDKANMRMITMNLASHLSGNKVLGNIWLSLSWNRNTEIDGNLRVRAGRTLTLTNSMTLTIDAGDTLFVDGTLQINGNVTISGSGVIKIGYAGSFSVASGVTATLNGVRMVAISTTGTVAVQSGGTLRVMPGTVLSFEEGTVALNVYGKLVANGTPSQRIVFTSSAITPAAGDWNGIICSGGGPDTLTYCDIKYATDGLWLQNTAANSYMQNDTIQYSSSTGYGVKVLSTGTANKALRMYKCGIKSNDGKGLLVSNAKVTISYTSIENNGLQSISTGIYLTGGARVFFDSSRIQNNNGSGIKISGTATRALLTPDSLKTGYNTITQHGVSEMWLLGSGSAFLGGGYAPGSYGGLNNVYNNFNYSCRLINNATSNQVSAKWTYWGSTGNRFCGPVDSSSPQGSPVNTPALMAYIPVGGENSTVESNPPSLGELLAQSKNDVVSNNVNAFDALHNLAIYAGPGGTYQNVLGSSWEDFLGNIEKSAASINVRSLAVAFSIQSKLDDEDFGNAIVSADSLLSKNVDDDLWFFCQTRKIFAYVGSGDIANAQSVFNSMKPRAELIDSDEVHAMNDYISLASKSSAGASSNSSLVKSSLRQLSTKPMKYVLEQNFPNPFNPTTTVRYEVPENVIVQVKIFDVLGREVSELVDEYKNVGRYEVSFAASKYPSGMYFYRLQAGTFLDVKKMLLVK